MTIVEQIAEKFRERGGSQYGGEPVTQLEHALQCAALAEQNQAAPTLIVAALLHDIGHVLHDLPDDAPQQGIDDFHENVGYQFLDQHFPESVSAPVRDHVAAKRYLCAVDNAYRGKLSEPSLLSLQLQGGAMTADEVEQFERQPHWRDAVQLRRWDDAAKAADLATKSLGYYLPLIERVLLDATR